MSVELVGSFSMFGPNLLMPTRLTKRNLCYINKSTMKCQQKLELHCFGYGYQKRVFIDSLIEYIGPPSCVD